MSVKSRLLPRVLLVLAASCSGQVVAQDLVMRRPLPDQASVASSQTGIPTSTPTPTATPTQNPTPTPSPTPSNQDPTSNAGSSTSGGSGSGSDGGGAGYSGNWATGDWSNWSGASCDASATRSRTVACVDSLGQTIEDSYCDPTKRPDASQTGNPDGCDKYDWDLGQSALSECVGGQRTISYPGAVCYAYSSQMDYSTYTYPKVAKVADSFCGSKPMSSIACTVPTSVPVKAPAGCMWDPLDPTYGIGRGNTDVMIAETNAESKYSSDGSVTQEQIVADMLQYGEGKLDSVCQQGAAKGMTCCRFSVISYAPSFGSYTAGVNVVAYVPRTDTTNTCANLEQLTNQHNNDANPWFSSQIQGIDRCDFYGRAGS